MKYIKVKKANCKNCYRCLKNCIVKSIKFENNKVNVIDELCILCGKCVLTCPQKAKQVNNDLLKIKEFINDKNIKTIASVAPSYITAFGDNYKKVVSILKKLGFDGAEETSIGAYYITNEYKNLIKQKKMKNIITSCCPTVNIFVQKYYPEILDCLAPIISPALAHGKLIKKYYGENTKVIFIGPCLSKIKEAHDNSQYLDGVISFSQILKWIENDNINIDKLEENEFDKKSSYSRIYPISDGIIFDIKKLFELHNFSNNINGYDLLSVSGLKDIKELFEEIKEGNIKNSFIEVNACSGGCINGPLMPEKRYPLFKSKISVKNYAECAEQNYNIIQEDFKIKYNAIPIKNEIPNEQEIRKILIKTGKYTKDEELNCGSCGYPTCREKAIAVYQKKAELYMCLPYITDINQTMSNVTLTITPDYIIAVDENMFIKEFNLSAQKLFKVSRNDVINTPLYELIDTNDFEAVIKNKSNIYNKKIKYDDLNIITSQTIIYSQEHNIAIGFIKDITNEEKKKDLIYKYKLDTAEMAQKVIDKQMMVSQQIASLMGETTAETKITLNKLKELVINEGSDSVV